MEPDDVVNFISHYKKSIEKHSEDRERILHCLTRLSKLKVNVLHLQVTGIGKTVNYVRKLEGEVGNLAKKLVTKWKDMVSDAEKVEKMKPPVPLFKLPIKLEPEECSPPFKIKEEEGHHLDKSSSSSSSNSESTRTKHKSDSHHHHSSRNGHSSKDDKKSKSNGSKPSKHHKSHHSRSSHSDSSSSKRKHDESSQDQPKDKNASHKKPKLEPEERPKEPSSPLNSSTANHHTKTPNNQKESSSSSLSSKPKDKSSKKKQESKEVEEEMDGSQGLGFAEALALFDMPSSSKNKKDLNLADKITKSKPKSPTKSSSKDDKRSSSSSTSEVKKKSLKALTAPPKLLSQKPKLEPLPDIVNDLPSDVSIPDYRPKPLNAAVKDYINSSVLGSNSNSYYLSRPPQKQMSASDLLVESFSSKANRTRVYSGNRVAKSVPPLFEMCIRVLQENIDSLETTGGVPFDILRPVLERAKPEQLIAIEYYNPYLLDESDILWEPHCKRKFRVRQRQEMESWREMFERCTREDEEKLNRLTQNIKQHTESTSNGVQKTMLAFVDSMVKPPRNVMRQQEIFGTNRKMVVSAAARTALRHTMPNIAAAGDARLRVASGLRDDAQLGGRGMPGRPIKKAPMMAKILSKFKR